jgi:integrase/recombinase XerD
MSTTRRPGQDEGLRSLTRPMALRPCARVGRCTGGWSATYAAWCRGRHLALFAARRAGIEGFARDLEARGRARATITRRLCTIAGLDRYAVEEELPGHSPAAHVRRPRLDYESHAVGLDRNEMGALLVAAGLGPAADHALISLLARSGLRVSEAVGASIENPGDRAGAADAGGHPHGRQGRHRSAGPADRAGGGLPVGERCDGPVFLRPAAAAWTATAPGRIVRRAARRAGIGKRVGPHRLRHAFITAALDAGVPLRDVQDAASRPDPRTTMRYDRARASLDRRATCIVAAYVAGAAR